MPLVKLETTVALSGEKRQTLLAALSKVAAETMSKPEQYVMVTASSTDALMGGEPGDAAFVDVRGIGGLSAEVNRKLAHRICGLLNESLKLPPDRIYLNFTDVEASHWGWNGSTFG